MKEFKLKGLYVRGLALSGLLGLAINDTIDFLHLCGVYSS